MCPIAKGSNEAATFEWLKADDLAEDLKCGRRSDAYKHAEKLATVKQNLLNHCFWFLNVTLWTVKFFLTPLPEVLRAVYQSEVKNMKLLNVSNGCWTKY